MDLFGFCNVAAIALRDQAFHRSEMVSQLLFGEAYKIVEQEASWVRIETIADAYQGYIDRNQVALMHLSSIKKYYLDKQPDVAQKEVLVEDLRRKISFWVPRGASFPFFEQNQIRLGADCFKINDYQLNTLHREEHLLSAAFSFINAPYLWGGRTCFGIDCSGFVQVVYKMIGIGLPRDAYQQAKEGKELNSLTDAQQGDLAFFVNDQNKIVHVGIVLNPQTIIHASAKVRVDKLDQQGIYCVEKEQYSHRLAFIKRVL